MTGSTETSSAAPAETAAPATVSPFPLADHLTNLRVLRDDVDYWKAKLDAARAAFNAEQAGTIETLKKAQALVDATETDVRALALAHFQRTGEKKPTPGVEIKMKTALDYDHDEALAWAKQTGLALVPESVDDKALRQIAKATPLPFVTVTETPQAQIATDLEKALGGAL